MGLPSVFSLSLPVEVVDSGGILVRQVDTNGVALDDATDVYSVALPVMPVDVGGVNEDSSKAFSTHIRVTLDPNGLPVVRVDPLGNAVSTALGASNAVNTIAPSITGTRGGTLSATPGTWTGATSVSGQWYSDGVATGNTTTSFTDTDTSASLEYRETALPGNVLAKAFLGASATPSSAWDTANSGPNWTYADSNKTATHANTGTDSTVRGTVPHSGTGDWSFSVVVTGNLVGPYVGLANASAPLTTAIGAAGGNSIGLWSGGGVRYNGTVTTVTGSSFVAGDTITTRLKNGKVYWAKNGTYVVGDPVAETGGYTAPAGALYPACSANRGMTYAGDFTNWASSAPALTAAINLQPGATGPSKKQIDIAATVSAVGATGAEFKVETAAGELVQGWTAMTFAAPNATGAYVIPDFAYEGQQFRVLVRNVGGTVAVGSNTTGTNGYVLQQQMRAGLNDTFKDYYVGNMVGRDIFQWAFPNQLSLGNPVPNAGGAGHSTILPPGVTLDTYGHWNEDYNPTQLYPATDGSSQYSACMYGGVQWTRTSTTARSGVAPDPADSNGTTSGWKRTGYAYGSVVGMTADGVPTKHPDDTNIALRIAVPWIFPSYPVTVHCKTSPGVKFKLDQSLGTISMTNVDLVAGTFDLVITGDNNAGLIFDRTTPIDSSFFLSGVPNYETGSPAADIGAPYVSAPKLADFAPFYGYRDMSANPINRNAAGSRNDFTAANVAPDGSTRSWKYDCDMANQLALPFLHLNVPDLADTAYVTAMATYFRDHLNPTTIVGVEWSNEVWNSGYQQYKDWNAAAASAGITLVQMYARQANATMAIWKSVWGAQASRVKGIYAWQAVATTSTYQSMLDFENAYQNVGYIAAAPYFGGGIGGMTLGNYAQTPQNIRDAVVANDQSTFNTLMDTQARLAVDLAVTAMKTLFDWLPTYSLSKGLDKNAIGLMAYEAGQHSLVDKSGWDAGAGAGMGDQAGTMMGVYKRSALFGATCSYYLDQMTVKCPHLMMWFDYCRDDHNSNGTWMGWGSMTKTGMTSQEPYATLKSEALALNA